MSDNLCIEECDQCLEYAIELKLLEDKYLKVVEALKFYCHESWHGPARDVLLELCEITSLELE